MDLNKARSSDGGVSGHLKRQTEKNARSEIEAKLPQPEFCDYCGKKRRSFRDVGEGKTVSRICGYCEKKAMDNVLGKPKRKPEAEFRVFVQDFDDVAESLERRLGRIPVNEFLFHLFPSAC